MQTSSGPFRRNGSVGALGTYLAIPVVMMVGVGLGASINPEVGAHGSLRLYWLLTYLRRVLFSGGELAVIGLWYLTCLSLVRGKARSWAWSALAIFGPFGLIGLTMLRNETPGIATPYERWIGRLNRFVRAVYEIALFVTVCVTADQIVELKRPLVIAWQSFVTGLPRDEIIRQQDASSGMWAFGEGMEMLYLLVLFYLLWPIGFNAARRLPGLRVGSRG